VKILRHKKFLKAYKKLNSKQRNLVDKAIMLFAANPFDAVLKNHELLGIHKGKRAIRAAHDLRIIYREENNHAIVIMLDTGSHSKVY
jgi:addiction module RelE/StbE family toxin